jgi:DNA-directed RNA polymerase subunit RPC12/RpoP
MKKICKQCGKQLPTELFYRNSRLKDGRFTKCKDCVNQNVVKASPEAIRRAQESFQKRYPEKLAANTKAKHLSKLPGWELHHFSYDEQHHLDVIPLLEKDHRLIHQNIQYDKATKLYRRRDNQALLETREAHKLFAYETILAEATKENVSYEEFKKWKEARV